MIDSDKKQKKAPERWPSGKAPSFGRQLDAQAAQAGLTQLPTMALVAVINTMIGILRERGHKIRDWDDKDKVVRKMMYIGGKIYILAPAEPSERLVGNGESREHDTGQ